MGSIIFYFLGEFFSIVGFSVSQPSRERKIEREKGKAGYEIKESP